MAPPVGTETGIFYRSAREETSVRHVRRLFEGLSGTSDVSARFDLDEGGMIRLHNHMNSSDAWKSVSQWDSGVVYTVCHPKGDISISDRNRGQDTRIYREVETASFEGSHPGGSRGFRLVRTERTPVDLSDSSCHSSRYSKVRVESSKTFAYESERASWDFILSVVWEGSTKEEAESSGKRWVATISMASAERASRDPGYTAASFMEKLMDTLSPGSERRCLVFSPRGSLGAATCSTSPSS